MSVSGRKRQTLICTVLILAILAIDQYLKSLVQLKLTAHQSIPIINNILHLTLVKNTGAAFGLFKNATVVFIIISIISILFISILVFRSIKKGKLFSNPVFNSGLVLIVSGALGNLIDRLKFGYVIDFIDVRIWPVFNMADASITIGTILVFLSFIYSKKEPIS